MTRSGAPPYSIKDSTTIIIPSAATADVTRVANMLAFQLRPPTNFAIPIVADTLPASKAPIRLRLAERADLGTEGYTLGVTPDSVSISAPTAAGLFHGIQTLRQLLPWRIESEFHELAGKNWQVPALAIVDRPRFAWRGAMLDVSRHFFSVDEVKQYIDILALYKFNTLHLHLGDDQGFRIEIKSRPTLTTAGDLQVGGGPGGFYTQADYSEIVRYAADRFITIVPEIDMPAHSNAMLRSYPQLSCGRRAPAPYTGIDVGFSALCPDNDSTYALLDDILGELAALTPGEYLHVGGDEVKALTKEQYIKFIDRVQDIVTKHGKKMVGWEEIAQAHILPTTISQQWQTDSARNALAAGAKLLMSPGPKAYIDMKQNIYAELGLRWAGYNEVRTSYDWDPATYVPGATEANIIGVEAPLWSESIRNITAAEYLAMPRLPSLAEVAWTPQAQRNWDDFRKRVALHAPRWRLLGINYYPSPQIPW